MQKNNIYIFYGRNAPNKDDLRILPGYKNTVETQSYITYDICSTITTGTPAFFSGVVNLASVHSILVRSSLNSGNSASTSQSNNDIIQKISLDVNYGGMIILNQNSVIRKNIIKSGSIRQFYLKLTEQNQKIIDLNSCNWEMS